MTMVYDKLTVTRLAQFLEGALTDEDQPTGDGFNGVAEGVLDFIRNDGSFYLPADVRETPGELG